MRGLIQIIIRYSALILFLLLEAISFYLIVEYNNSQKTIFVNSSNLFFGTVNQQISNFKNYFALQPIVDSLATENAKLRNQLGNKFYNNRSTNIQVSDSSFLQQFIYTQAQVVNNNISGRNNYFTINRGSRHGITKGMGVVGLYGKGVLGIITKCDQSFSQVLSVLHSESRIPSKVKRIGYFGSLEWEGSNPAFAQLKAVPNHAQILKGDTIVTHGGSQIFPANIPIGTIYNIVQNPGENFFDIDIKLFSDPSKINIVYVVTNLMKYDFESEENSSGIQ